jgi:tetratricopeptide (TPR) repeat protein
VARRSLQLAAEAEAQSESTADDWYNAGVDLESVAADQAAAAYAKALELDPAHADALVNLGRLLHEGGDMVEAENRYRAAASADPDSGRPRYNLGVLLEDLGRTQGAIEAYLDAIRVDPFLASAHFNVSRLLEASGRGAQALSHLADYKRLIDRGDASA